MSSIVFCFTSSGIVANVGVSIVAETVGIETAFDPVSVALAPPSNH